MQEQIQIVDKNDHPIGSSTRQDAYAKGLYYRIVQIVLRDEKGSFLLQKRSMEKLLYPGRWTSAASGHVDDGETYETAASRELVEEIGINVPLTFVGKFLIQKVEDDKIINQFNGVFEGHTPHDTILTLQSEEVSEVDWFTVEELRERTCSTPHVFTPAMARLIEAFYS